MDDNQQDEYAEEIDAVEEDDYDDDEVYDDVNPGDFEVNQFGNNPPYQVIGNQFVDSRGRPQSANVNSNEFGSGNNNFHPSEVPDMGQAQPGQAYQFNNYQSDALSFARQFAGKKNKRPVSASHPGKAGRNPMGEIPGGVTQTAQNSKMGTEISFTDIKRMKPRRINQEKEKLYDQVIKLKVQMNSYKNANLKLRTQLKFLEKEQNEKEGIIESLVNNNEVSTIGRLGSVINNKK